MADESSALGTDGVQSDDMSSLDSRPVETSGQPQAIDLDQLPEFRKLKSKEQRERARLENQIEALQLQLQAAQARAKAASDTAARIAEVAGRQNPDIAAMLAREAEVAELRAQLEAANATLMQIMARQQEQEQWAQFEEYHQNDAREMGIDPDDPRLLRAIRSGDNKEIARVKKTLLEEKLKAHTQQSRKPAPEPLPPAGGAPPTDDDVAKRQLWKEYYERVEQLRSKGQMNDVIALRREYRKKGLPL